MHSFKCICTGMTQIPETDPPEPGIARCAQASLRRAMRVVSQHYDAALKPAGLRATQFTLLAVLDGKGPMPVTRLADLLVVDRTTLTRNLKPLAAKGWIEIGTAKDERVRPVEITEKGRAVVARATPLWAATQEKVEAGLGQDEFSALTRLLADLTETLKPADA